MTSKPPPATSGLAEAEKKPAKEPDATQVRPEHVTELLKWYGPKVRYSDIHTHHTHLVSWQNALAGNLTLGEMRRGIRLLSTVDKVPMMTGVQFWKLCKGQASTAEIEKANEKRHTRFTNSRL